MSIKLLLGPSGAGKTYVMNSEIISNAKANPGRNYIVVVPEQFTMETQRKLIENSDTDGLLNVDVVSFKRLAFRVFEELGINLLTILDDTGKSLLIRKIINDISDEFEYFTTKSRVSGFVEEVKSAISEFLQYGINSNKLMEMSELSEAKPVLRAKLSDIAKIYKKFDEYEFKYVTKEKILSKLSDNVYKSKIVANSEIYFDGFTGFTPVQYELIERLAEYSKALTFVLTISNNEISKMGEFGYKSVSDFDLFKLSKDTINKLYDISVATGVKMLKPTVISEPVPYRLKNMNMLAHLHNSLEAQVEVTNRLTKYEGKITDEIEILSCKNIRIELMQVASYIAGKVRSGELRYKDFAIIAADVASYADIAPEIFGLYEVPVFIDNKRSIVSNPFVVAIRAAIEIIDKNYSYESVMTYLRSGMTNITRDEVDLFDNYLLKMGIKGRTKFERSIGDSEDLEAIRVKFMEPFAILHNVFSAKKKTVYQMTKALYDFIVYFDMENKIKNYLDSFNNNDELELVLEYRQIYKNVMELLDKLVNTIGEEEVTIKDYKDILNAGFEEIKVTIIPPTLDQVVFGDTKRTRLSDIKELIFIGVTDNVIPMVEGSKNLLSQAEREFLRTCDVEISPTSRENMFIQKFYMYMNLTKPSRKLILSYPNMGGSGALLTPAYIIDNIKEMFEGIKVKVVREEDIPAVTKESGMIKLATTIRKYREAYRDKNALANIDALKGLMGYYYNDEEYSKRLSDIIEQAFIRNESNPIDEAVVNAIYGGDFTGSITRLEKFASCQFAHFMQYGLNLMPRKEYAVTSMDLGNIYHEIIECYFKKIKGLNKEYKIIEKEEIAIVAKSAIEEVCTNYDKNGLFMTARDAYMKSRIERTALRTIDILMEHIRKGGFTPKYHELAFGKDGVLDAMNYNLKNGQKMKLTGKIDRVDIKFDEDGKEMVKIIDYKSSDRQFDIDAVNAGIQIQMLVYMDAFVEKERKEGIEAYPGAILYFKVDDPMIDGKTGDIDDITLNEEISKSFIMNGLISDDTKVIENIDNDINKISNVINVERINESDKSSGAFKSRTGTTVATKEELENIILGVRENIQKMGDEIVSGHNEINPYKTGGKTPCKYCDFKDVCSFDDSIGNTYRKIGKQTTEEEEN